MNRSIMNRTHIPNSKSGNFLKRDRIDALLEEAIEKPLTIVTAGAGFGKTYTISCSLAAFDYDVVWMQFTELDNLVARFWIQFSRAFEAINPSLAQKLHSLGYPTTPSGYHQTFRLLEKELATRGRCVLVFDDLHFITNPSILTFFETLIAVEPIGLSIMLISRTKPLVHVTSMLSKHSLSTIREEDLRFTYDEVREYYELQGTIVSESELKKLFAYTEGWIFAIYLTGLSLKSHLISAEKLISHTKIDIYDLLEKEVFNSAPESLQNLLLTISVLDYVPAGLLLELTSHNVALIQDLNQSSLLIRHDLVTDHYRIHNLFKSYLENKAKQNSNIDVSQIHLVAAKWFKKNDFPVDAINHFRLCQQYEDIFSIILAVHERQSYEVNESFIALIDEAPPSVIEKLPIMRVVRANYLFNNNLIQEAYNDLEALRAEYEAKTPSEEQEAILGEVYITLALISIVSQTFEFVELFKKADACLPNGSQLVNQELSIGEGLNICGIKNPDAGELEKHQQALFEAAPYAVKVMNGGGAGMDYLSAADVALMTGDLKNVEKYAFEAIYRANGHKQYDIEYMANFYLIRMYVAKGNYQQAKTILASLRDKFNQVDNAMAGHLLDIIEGWFYVKIGKIERVESWIMDEEKTRKLLAPIIVGREYLVRSDSFLAQERYYELLAFMEQQDVTYQKRGILYALIQNEITRSIIHHYLGNEEQALAALEHAYELSSPNALIFQYIEYGTKMRTVLNAAKSNENCKIPREWLDMIYTKTNTYAKMLSKCTGFYNLESNEFVKETIQLTKREKEILTNLCDGLTREEMALNCNLSANTVKSVLQNIYNKLGAINNFDAIRLATSMELI